MSNLVRTRKQTIAWAWECWSRLATHKLSVTPDWPQSKPDEKNPAPQSELWALLAEQDRIRWINKLDQFDLLTVISLDISRWVFICEDEFEMNGQVWLLFMDCLSFACRGAESLECNKLQINQEDIHDNRDKQKTSRSCPWHKRVRQAGQKTENLQKPTFGLSGLRIKINKTHD